MRRETAILAALFACIGVYGQEQELRKARYERAIKAHQADELAKVDGAIQDAEKRLKKCRKASITIPRNVKIRSRTMIGNIPVSVDDRGRYHFSTRKGKNRALKTLRSDLINLQKERERIKAHPTMPPLLGRGRPLAVGDIGIFPRAGVLHGSLDREHWSYSFKVAQVIDNDEMLVTITYHTTTPRYANQPSRGGQLVIQGYSRRERQSQIWIRGVRTDGLVDDQPIELNRLFEIVGTKRYQTTMGGRKTVLLAEAF